MIGKVTLFPRETYEFVRIPITSITEGDDQLIYVYVPDQSDTIAVRKTIEIERFSDEHVWARKDQLLDKRIITTGSAYLKDGQIIRIINDRG